MALGAGVFFSALFAVGFFLQAVTYEPGAAIPASCFWIVLVVTFREFIATFKDKEK